MGCTGRTGWTLEYTVTGFLLTEKHKWPRLEATSVNWQWLRGRLDVGYVRIAIAAGI